MHSFSNPFPGVVFGLRYLYQMALERGYQWTPSACDDLKKLQK